MADHVNMHWSGAMQLLTDGCPWFASKKTAPVSTSIITPTPRLAQTPAPTPAHVSGFDNDFMAHAVAMDARKQGVPGSAVKKMEGIMASNDHAQRKMRSSLMKAGLGL